MPDPLLPPLAWCDAMGAPICDVTAEPLEVDSRDPRFCRCPTCGARKLTPQHTLNGFLVARLAYIEIGAKLHDGVVTGEQANQEIESVLMHLGLSAVLETRESDEQRTG